MKENETILRDTLLTSIFASKRTDAQEKQMKMVLTEQTVVIIISDFFTLLSWPTIVYFSILFLHSYVVLFGMNKEYIN